MLICIKYWFYETQYANGYWLVGLLEKIVRKLFKSFLDSRKITFIVQRKYCICGKQLLPRGYYILNILMCAQIVLN